MTIFTLSHAEEVWLTELEGWLRIGGLDRLPDRRAFLREVVSDVLWRFDKAVKDGSLKHSTLMEQLKGSAEMLEAAE